MKYNKQVISIVDQIQTLQQRGLIINDREKAIATLERTSYFRLAGYWRAMEKDPVRHLFLPNSHFDDVLLYYRFGKDLKLLLFSAVQTIEVAVRTRIIQRFSSAHGSFWFMESDKAIDKAFFYSNLDSIRREVQRSKEDFITDHFNKYSIPDLPPAWKTLEVVSLGMLSKLFRNFADKQSKDQVAADFDLPQHLILEGWLESLTTLRNHIAHHARVCNRRFPHKPELLRKIGRISKSFVNKGSLRDWEKSGLRIGNCSQFHILL